MNIYVGNLPYNFSVDELRQMFSVYGRVLSADIILDKMTGRSRGFGFVEMEEYEAREAIQALNGSELGARTLTVTEARPRTEGGTGSGGGRMGGGRPSGRLSGDNTTDPPNPRRRK